VKKGVQHKRTFVQLQVKPNIVYSHVQADRSGYCTQLTSI